MATSLAKTYKANDGQELTLTTAYVARLVLGGNVDNVPESEYAKVIMTCAARGLNPLAGDVAVQPRWDKKRGCNILSVVPTKDYFQRRASAHPSYMGKEYGIVVFNANEGKIRHKEGTGYYPSIGEQLLGGWCRVHVKGHDRPEYAEVSIDEYDQNYALWNTKKATMIAKVAKSQALREAFPNEFQGLYEPEEMGIDTDADGEPIIEQAVTIESEDGTVSTRVPVFEDDGQRDASVSEVVDYDPEGWQWMTPEERDGFMQAVAAREDFDGPGNVGWEEF